VGRRKLAGFWDSAVMESRVRYGLKMPGRFRFVTNRLMRLRHIPRAESQIDQIAQFRCRQVHDVRIAPAAVHSGVACEPTPSAFDLFFHLQDDTAGECLAKIETSRQSHLLVLAYRMSRPSCPETRKTPIAQAQKRPSFNANRPRSPKTMAMLTRCSVQLRSSAEMLSFHNVPSLALDGKGKATLTLQRALKRIGRLVARMRVAHHEDLSFSKRLGAA
jgi:hypothetical protein